MVGQIDQVMEAQNGIRDMIRAETVTYDSKKDFM
jgi:hypothetical protein